MEKRITTSKICIYCKCTDKTKFKGVEHVLLRSFGTFGTKTPTLHCVCDSCNQFFKKELDQIFARESIEGVTRYRKGILSSESRLQKDLQFSIAEGRETGDFGGALIYGVDAKTGKLLGPVSQFHILNLKTKEYDKFYKDKIKDIKLSEEIYGKLNERKMKILAPSLEEHNAVIGELQKAGITYRENNKFQLPIKVGEDTVLPVTVEGKINKIRKRAIVKLLFNFAAYYLGEDEVLKNEWNKVRRFVRFNGSTIKGRISTKPFWDGQETENKRFSSDSYNLRIENQNGNIVGGLNKHKPDFIVMVCNTIHLFYKELQKVSKSKILDVRKCILERIEKLPQKDVYILGTPSTVKEKLYFVRDKKYIELGSADGLFISEVVEKYNLGINKEMQIGLFNEFLEKINNDNSIIILGCTELALMNRNSSKNIINTLDIMVEETLKLYKLYKK